MKQTFWKVLAIIAVVVVILESVFLCYVYGVGRTAIMFEEVCGTTCGLDPGAGFYYLSYDKCYCLDASSEVVKTFTVDDLL